MNRRPLRERQGAAASFLVALALVLAGLWGQPAAARSDFRYAYPEQVTVSPTGVNLQTGRLVYSKADITIGDLSLLRSWGGAPAALTGRMFGAYVRTTSYVTGWTHNLNQGVGIESSGGDSFYNAYVDGQLFRYLRLNDGTILAWNDAARGSNLTVAAPGYVLVSKNGTRYSFTTTTGTSAVLTLAEYGDGRRISYGYNAGWQPRSVISSLGYAIIIDYGANQNIMAACGFNLATQYADNSSSCAGATLKATYAYDGTGTDLASVTDVSGDVVQFVGYANMGGPLCITLPNVSTCELQNSYSLQPGEPAWYGVPPDVVRVQTMATGEVWRYNYDFGEDTSDVPIVAGKPRWAWTYVVDPQGREYAYGYDRGTLVHYSPPSGRKTFKYPSQTWINRTTTWDYRGTEPVLVRYPAGNAEYFLYDQRGNVMLHSFWPKGAPNPIAPADPALDECCVLPSTPAVMPAGSVTFGQAFLPSLPSNGDPYPNGCGAGAIDAKLCDKPIAKIDAKGNQTDFTYDRAHGGVLTETGPAVNGVRPQVRYSYMQRSAWVKDAGGAYVSTGQPVWLLASKSLCKTSSATGNPASPCTAGASDEVLSLYEYGPDSGPNNLQLRGTVEDATGAAPARACFSYDWQGNKISETKPKGTTGLGACP